MILTLYKKLLTLYPRTFQERLGESMEQTFQDLWKEKRQTKKGFFGFMLWTFIETAIGVFREHLLLISPADVMQTILQSLRSSAVISFLLTVPFMVMEIVNRRNFNEEFPIILFFAIWLNLFAICLILLPIVRSRQGTNREMGNPAPVQRDTLLMNSRLATIISVVILLVIVPVVLLYSLGSNPEQLYVLGFRVPSQFIALVLLSLPVAAGMIAGRPIVNTLRDGGSLFAHPIHLIIVVLILSTFAIGLASFIIDQWPCFIGVPNCD